MLDRRLLLKGGIAAAALGAMPMPARAAGTKVNAPFPIFDTHPHFYSPDTAKYPYQIGYFARGTDQGDERADHA